MEYPKTENLWRRDEETHLMSPANGLRMEELHQVKEFLVLEKIDGMNMRVVWDTVHEDMLTPAIYGRTDRAQIPGDLMAFMVSKFTTKAMCLTFDTETEAPWGTYPTEVVLFGEGYGPGIQQGGHYRDDKSFALFDVMVDGKWLRWSDVVDVATKLGIDTVPVLARSRSIESIEDMLTPGIMQGYNWSTETPEGVIARTDPYLFDGRGRRVMFKHKCADVGKYLASL